MAKKKKNVRKAVSKPVVKKSCQNCNGDWWMWIVAEVAFYALFYYGQYLLRIEANLWVSSLVLWALVNIAILFCPVVRKCYK